jgi:D-glycero-D-manno-heptose 1,7-bisphosphate phosphatase
VKRAVFFDRDGVLNEAIVADGKPYPPPSLAELRIVNEAPAAVAAVHEAGYLAIGATNQPDVARGTAKREDVDAINAAVVRATGLDAIYTCPHDDGDACACRKPKPGLLLRAAREHDVDLAQSFLIGDRMKDVACGRAAGVTTILIDRGYAQTGRRARGDANGPDAVVHTLEEAVRWVVLSGARPKNGAHR